MDVQPDERIKHVHCTKDSLSVDLLDGRTISVPLAWYPRLLHATASQRAKWQIAGGGYGIHWPEIDEDLSVEGLLRGLPAPQVSRDIVLKRVPTKRSSAKRSKRLPGHPRRVSSSSNATASRRNR